MELHLLIVFLMVCSTLGVPTRGRIFGGNPASPGQFPYIVALNNIDQFCDGSIINKNWILTAAHCLPDITSNTSVLVGTNIEHSGGTTYSISKAIAHEDYDSNTTRNDLGLIQIDGEFEFSNTVQAIEFGDPEENATCVAVGWGATEHVSFPEELQFVELRALSLEECQGRVGDLDPFYLGSEQVCALGPEGKGVCFGDSGGPLVCGGRLAGVVSYSVSVCAQGYPDVYTRPSFYVDWINRNVQNK